MDRRITVEGNHPFQLALEPLLMLPLGRDQVGLVEGQDASPTGLMGHPGDPDMREICQEYLRIMRECI